MNLNGNAIIKAGAMSLVPLLKVIHPSLTPKHAREHIGVSNVKTDRDSSEKIVTVGYTKGVFIVFMQQSSERCTKVRNYS